MHRASSSAVQGSFTVPFTVAGTATLGADFTVMTATPLTFTGATAGEALTITVNVVTDSIVEANETVIITLGIPIPTENLR